MRIKIIYSILFLFGSLTIAGQKFDVYKGDTINFTDFNNLKQGKWISFQQGSTYKILEGIYVNNEKESIWISYYPDGKIKSAITYNQGEKKGFAKIYFENGNIAEEGTWDVDRWIGTYNSYYKNGKLFYAWNYDQRGTRSGYQKYFYENGNVKIEGVWENGKESGLIKDYYSDGSLRTEKVFRDGKIDSESIKAYLVSEKKISKDPVNITNENISKETAIKENIKTFSGTGYHVLYNIEKQIEKEGEFTNGILINGKQIIYDNEGNLLRTLIYENGKVIKFIDHK